MHLYAENTSGKTHKKLKERGTWRLKWKDVLFFIITFLYHLILLYYPHYLSKTAKITTVPWPHSRPINSEFLNFQQLSQNACLWFFFSFNSPVYFDYTLKSHTHTQTILWHLLKNKCKYTHSTLTHIPSPVFPRKTPKNKWLTLACWRVLV